VYIALFEGGFVNNGRICSYLIITAFSDGGIVRLLAFLVCIDTWDSIRQRPDLKRRPQNTVHTFQRSENP
jgi:hypothetical protein